MARLRRGEVRWYTSKRPDKRRPVLVLTRNSALEFLAEATIAPITSSIRDIPTEVYLDERDGMPRPCAVNLDHLQTVACAKIGGLLTALSAEQMRAVSRATSFALDLQS